MVPARTRLPRIILFSVFLATACEKPNRPATRPSAENHRPSGSVGTEAHPAAHPAAVDQWLGQWNGPEGTYLRLAKKAGRYSVRIQSLDGVATYAATQVGDHIEFQRDGKTESIRAGSGEQTGMKWLLEKKHCLVIKLGEGFCRD
jgi:hypothetical protein